VTGFRQYRQLKVEYMAVWRRSGIVVSQYCLEVGHTRSADRGSTVVKVL